MIRPSLLIIATVALVVSACAPAATPTSPAATSVPPTKAAPTVAVPTATTAPTDTPLPPAATETSVPAVEGAIEHFAAGQALSLSMIQMIDASTGWGVAPAETYGNDHLLRTVDGGLTWQDVTPAEPAGTTDEFPLGKGATTFFLDANTGWATFYDRAGGQIQPPTTVWATTDGGQTWASSVVDVGFTDGLYQPNDLTFSDAQNGALLVTLDVGMSQSYVAVLTTNDGGATWNRVVDPDKGNIPTGCSKERIAFVDAQNGWMVGNCGGVVPETFVYHTTDGGNTWAVATLPVPEGEAADVFTNFDAKVCFADYIQFAGVNGRMAMTCAAFEGVVTRWLYVTDNGGETWSIRNLPIPYGQFAFAGEAGWYLAIPGNDPSVETELFQTTDGGVTWNSIHKQLWTGSMSFVDAQTGWVAAKAADGSYALVQSVDGGAKWSVVAPVSK